MITVLISPLEFCHMQKFLHLACLWQPNWLQTYGFFRRAPAGTFTTQRENPFRRAARRLTRTGRQPDPIDNRWGQTVQNLRENPFQRAERQTAATHRQKLRSNSTESAWESLPKSGLPEPTNSRNPSTTGEVKQYRISVRIPSKERTGRQPELNDNRWGQTVHNVLHVQYYSGWFV